MKAKIIIKNRREPLEIEYARAIRLKELLTNPETDRDSMVDLGDWVGQLKEIKAIDIQREPVVRDKVDTDAIKYEEEHQKLLKMSPEVRAMNTVGMFKLGYFCRSGYKKDASPETIQEAILLNAEYYREHPERSSPDSKIYEEIYTRDFGSKKVEPFMYSKHIKL